MGWNTPDLYNEPEHFGLEIVGTLEDPDACYSFDTFVVWRKKSDGTLYYGTDSGCSCPSPFEDFTSLDDAHKAENWQEIQSAAEVWRDQLTIFFKDGWAYNRHADYRAQVEAEIGELVRKVAG